ncbi:MAG: hypothetical protein ACREIC_07110 [Limisphaerales bacterium]
MPKATVKTKVQVRRDHKVLTDAPEVSVFLICLGLINQLRSLEQAFRQGTLKDRVFFDKFNTVLAQLSSIAEATERFDILLPVMDYGCFSPFFWRWFNWWDDYMKALDSSEIGQIDRLARTRKPSVGEYRPEGDWVQYRHTPSFRLVFS